jgi:hypothetical protein
MNKAHLQHGLVVGRVGGGDCFLGMTDWVQLILNNGLLCFSMKSQRK